MRRILHVFHGCHTAAHGAFGAPPMDVRGFPSADVFLWRGKGSSAFGLTFEESTDQNSWFLCAGADVDRDPKEMRDLIRELKRRGKTVFFSTHIIPDVESLCDRVGVIIGGRLHDVGRIV